MIVYLGLGSNLGDRLENIRNAIRKIGLLKGVDVMRVSTIYETEPVLCDGDWFYNAVLEIECGWDPISLMAELLGIEKSLGRKQSREKGSARVIDLDILFWGQKKIDEPTLTLPHSRLHLRRFVLEPLCELNAALIHPVLEKSAGELLEVLQKEEAVAKLPEHALSLRASAKQSHK